MTTTAIAIETTETTETTETIRDDERTTTGGDAHDDQRPDHEPQPRTEAGTAYLPGATPGVIAINWK